MEYRLVFTDKRKREGEKQRVLSGCFFVCSATIWDGTLCTNCIPVVSHCAVGTALWQGEGLTFSECHSLCVLSRRQSVRLCSHLLHVISCHSLSGSLSLKATKFISSPSLTKLTNINHVVQKQGRVYGE